MFAKAIFVLGAAALALAGCNQQDNTTAQQAGDVAQDVGAAAAGVGAGGMGAVSTDAYVRDAAIADLYEIEASRLALERSQSPQVKEAAQMIIDDHTRASSGLTQALSQSGLNLQAPTALDARRKEMIENLRTATPEQFDDRYLDQQSAAHQEALVLHSGYGRMGDNPALKAHASATAPVIEKHREMVIKLDRGTEADDEGAAQAAH